MCGRGGPAGRGSRRFLTLFMRLGQSVKIYENEITFPVGRYLNGTKFWLKSLALVSQTASEHEAPLGRTGGSQGEVGDEPGAYVLSLIEIETDDGEIDRQIYVCVWAE